MVIYNLNNKKEEISEASEKIIFSAASNYLNNKTITYPKLSGNTYCITLDELVQNGELSSPVKDIKSGNEISLNTIIKASLNAYSDYEYCLVDETDVTCNSCTEIRN